MIDVALRWGLKGREAMNAGKTSTSGKRESGNVKRVWCREGQCQEMRGKLEVGLLHFRDSLHQIARVFWD